ncbi:MAG: PIN domain-containing protein [Armatimonadetes bacterium]|nr:PIN domain-containing protein [Armatimonadota bacterium]
MGRFDRGPGVIRQVRCRGRGGPCRCRRRDGGSGQPPETESSQDPAPAALHPEENAERLRIFLSGQIDVLSVDADDASTAGEVRACLERSGTPIGPYDLLIAAQALRTGAILVTANVSEFARIKGLQWEDWSQAD